MKDGNRPRVEKEGKRDRVEGEKGLSEYLAVTSIPATEDLFIQVSLGSLVARGSLTPGGNVSERFHHVFPDEGICRCWGQDGWDAEKLSPKSEGFVLMG